MEEVREQGLTRGRLLKRAGIGAAALWAAPTLTTAAQAHHGGRHTCGTGFPCGGDPCFDQSQCRPADPNCICYQRANVDVCWCGGCPFSPCDAFIQCRGGADCPEGTRCVRTCCEVQDPNAGICMPACSTDVCPGDAQPLAAGTRTPSGIAR
jgi:hypothetical protein